MTVALFAHPACLGHDNGPFHPECPDRLRAVLQALEHPDFVPLLRESAPEATAALLELGVLQCAVRVVVPRWALPHAEVTTCCVLFCFFLYFNTRLRLTNGIVGL